jgi:hypothetical protein
MADDMEKPLTATELRADVYRILDSVIETGRSRTIVRGGSRLVITLEADRRLDLDSLPRREATPCSPDELVETSWEGEWKP